MLIEMYIFFELLVIGLFITSFFTKQEILWALTCLVTVIPAYFSWSVEKTVYLFNSTSSSYYPSTVTYSYPYLNGINIGFFVLALIFLIFDLWDKYGPK